MFLGLRSHIVATPDLDATKDWYSEVLGYRAYFDEPFYVGFNVGGFELGLLPKQDEDYPIGGETYWGVADIKRAWEQLLAHGARPAHDITDVGEGILMAVIRDPAGNRIGIIENPHFEPGKTG